MSKLLFGFVALMGSAVWAAPQPKAGSSADVPAVIPECVLAERWVEANRASLPTTLAAFSEHSMAYRRAIYDALDVEARISLWQEHVATVADQVKLPEQRLFLQGAIPELDKYVSDAPSESELEAFGEETISVLGKDLTRTAFGVLGFAPEPTTAEGDVQLPDCSCAVGWSFLDCVEGSKCKGRKWIIFDVCRDLETGCGLFLEMPCNGLCFQQNPN